MLWWENEKGFGVYNYYYLLYKYMQIISPVEWITTQSFYSWLSYVDREGNGTPLQYSCLENPMDRGAWKAAVHGVAEGRTWLSNFTFTFHFHALEKEMATHFSALAWRILGMGEPRGLPSMGSHRVGHDWSDSSSSRGKKNRIKKVRRLRHLPKAGKDVWWGLRLRWGQIFASSPYSQLSCSMKNTCHLNIYILLTVAEIMPTNVN